MDLELNGKTAIVTGGSRGIGKAISLQLASEGVEVAIVARNMDQLQNTATEINTKTGQKIIPIQADMSDKDSIESMVTQANNELGSVDILVNNAAVPGGGAAPHFSDITTDDFWSDMNLKVLGYLRCSQFVAPLMKERKWGRIINISGLAARSVGTTVGSMRNVAVAAMTKNLAHELGPHGINVTVVHPGLTYTERVPNLLKSISEKQGKTIEEVTDSFGTGNTIQKIITAEEVAYVVAFLASPKSISINGDALAVGGGVGSGIYY